jgi:acetyltransferase-like isoleucine patch superfamily enzyme
MHFERWPEPDAPRSAAVLGDIQLGEGVTLEAVEFEQPNIISNFSFIKESKIGSFSAAGHFLRCIRTDMGRFVSIGDNVLINAGVHPIEWLSTHMFTWARHPWKFTTAMPQRSDLPTHDPRSTVHIGNDVWIGANVVIMPGITIGDGAVIGANAVVSRDVLPYAVVAGVPARQLRTRFEPETIARLLRARWWDLPIEHIQHLPFDDINACLELLERRP